MRILIIHDYLPRTGRDGADERLLQVIRSLRSLGHHVTFAARGCPSPSDADMITAELLLEVDELWIGDRTKPENCQASHDRQWDATRFAQVAPFPVILVTLWFWNLLSVAEEYAPMLRRLSPASFVLCLSDDCHGRRVLEATRASGSFTDTECAMDFELRELKVMSLCDGAVVVSQSDAAYLRERLPSLRVFHIGYAVSTEAEVTTFSLRSGFLVFGDFRQRGAVNAARWVNQRVWPALRTIMPSASLIVAGHGSETVSSDAGPGIRCMGSCPDPRDLLRQTRVFFAPMLSGTGVPTEILLSMGCGTPVVTTSVRARPLNLVYGQHAMTADSAEQQARILAEVHSNETLWLRLSRNAVHYVREQCSRQSVCCATHAMLCAIFARPGTGHGRTVAEEKVIPSRLPAETEEIYVMRRFCLGRRLVLRNRPAEALNHLRFVLPAVEQQAPSSQSHIVLLRLLAEAYRRIGHTAHSERCRQEAERIADLTGGSSAAQMLSISPAVSS